MAVNLAIWLMLYRTCPFQPQLFYSKIKSFKSKDYHHISAKVHQQVEQDLAWQKQSNCHIITMEDSAYPSWLKKIYDPPPLLFVKGELDCLDKPAIGIVGSRLPTLQGRRNSFNLAKQLACRGWNVVSGLAYGVDKESHLGALQAGGKTLAVLAHGLDRIYPKEHTDLAQKITQQGALISEYPLGFLPKPFQFLRRNRLISGISRGVLVVEAKLNSGSLVTARLALEEGREVFAVPGPIHLEQSRGCHELIRQGAKLVETEEDIVNELGLGFQGEA